MSVEFKKVSTVSINMIYHPNCCLFHIRMVILLNESWLKQTRGQEEPVYALLSLIAVFIVG